MGVFEQCIRARAESGLPPLSELLLDILPVIPEQRETTAAGIQRIAVFMAEASPATVVYVMGEAVKALPLPPGFVIDGP